MTCCMIFSKFLFIFNTLLVFISVQFRATFYLTGSIASIVFGSIQDTVGLCYYILCYILVGTWWLFVLIFVDYFVKKIVLLFYFCLLIRAQYVLDIGTPSTLIVYSRLLIIIKVGIECVWKFILISYLTRTLSIFG